MVVMYKSENLWVFLGNLDVESGDLGKSWYWKT